MSFLVRCTKFVVGVSSVAAVVARAIPSGTVCRFDEDKSCWYSNWTVYMKNS